MYSIYNFKNTFLAGMGFDILPLGKINTMIFHFLYIFIGIIVMIKEIKCENNLGILFAVLNIFFWPIWVLVYYYEMR